MGQSREGVRRHGGLAAGHRPEGILTHRVMQSHCVELSPLGSMQSPKNHASGEFAPNTARLTVSWAGDRVADGEKRYLNFLFAPHYLTVLRARRKLYRYIAPSISTSCL